MHYFLKAGQIISLSPNFTIYKRKIILSFLCGCRSIKGANKGKMCGVQAGKWRIGICMSNPRPQPPPHTVCLLSVLRPSSQGLKQFRSRTEKWNWFASHSLSSSKPQTFREFTFCRKQEKSGVSFEDRERVPWENHKGANAHPEYTEGPQSWERAGGGLWTLRAEGSSSFFMPVPGKLARHPKGVGTAGLLRGLGDELKQAPSKFLRCKSS